MNNNLRILGLAKKAGLLAIGTESVTEAARQKKAAAILSASDASDRSKRQAHRNSEDCGAIHIIVPYTKMELAAVIGRGEPGMIAILDKGLADKFTEELQ